MRTIAEIEHDIKSAISAREAMAGLPGNPDGKWDEGRAIFIENCNNRLTELGHELERAKEKPDE